MIEQINLNLDSINGDGSGLYVADFGTGIHVFEEQSGNPVSIDGGYLTLQFGSKDYVFTTVIEDDGDVHIIDAETMEVSEVVPEDKIEDDHITAQAVIDLGFTSLELVN